MTSSIDQDQGLGACPTGTVATHEPSQDVSALTGECQLAGLIEQIEAAAEPSKALDRKIALAVGWVRQSPTEARRKHPAWFHPDDCRNGRVVMDSLHGTDVWRDPLAYTTSVDAALTLLPDGWCIASLEWWPMTSIKAGITLREVKKFEEGFVSTGYDESCGAARSRAQNPALALCAAALRAKAVQS
jgi:hypothetical protein